MIGACERRSLVRQRRRIASPETGSTTRSSLSELRLVSPPLVPPLAGIRHLDMRGGQQRSSHARGGAVQVHVARGGEGVRHH